MFTERRSGRHDELGARRRVAAARAAAASEECVPCTLARPRDAPHAAKYHEGEVAALGEAMRIVATAGPVDALPLVTHACKSWAHKANSLSASPSPAWRAYHEGGRDALQAFLAAEHRDLDPD